MNTKTQIALIADIGLACLMCPLLLHSLRVPQARCRATNLRNRRQLKRKRETPKRSGSKPRVVMP